MKQRVQRFAEQFAREVEERKLWWLAFFSILYLGITLFRAATKPLWFDELFTFYVSRLPGLRDVWSALASGFDPNPPLPYLLTRFSHALLGEGEVATRLPAILGFWLMCVCLFWFVRQRTSALDAAAAMSLPLVTMAYGFAHQARGYSLVLGSSALALLCWQSVGGRRRGLALGGLALSLAAGVSSHYYAALALCAIGLGELCRSVARKRIDVPVWLMMALGLAPLVAYAPLIRSGMSNVLSPSMRTQVFFMKPTLGRVPEYYTHLLGPALPAAVLSLVVVALALKLGLLEQGIEDRRSEEGPPLHELVAAGGFLLMPVFLYIAATLVTGYFMDRYTVAGVLGCATLLGFGLHHAAGRRQVAGVIVLGCLLVWFVAGQFVPQRLPHEFFREGVLETKDAMYPRGDDRPIAVANALLYLQMFRYGSPEVVSRIRYVSDPHHAVRHVDFVAELALRRLREWAPIKVEEYATFLAAHRSFWVYHNGMNQVEWLVAQLAADGWRVELHAQDRDLLLFLVTEREAKGGGAVGETRGAAERQGVKDGVDGRPGATAAECAAARNGARQRRAQRSVPRRDPRG